MSRWSILILSWALVLGVMARSPIPEMEDSIQLWNEMTRDPAFRLPTTTAPESYNVILTPYFENINADLAFTFDGIVTINFRALQADVTEIVLHCNDLTIQSLSLSTTADGSTTNVPTDGAIPVCDPVYDFLRINVQQALVENQQYAVNIVYRGNLQTNMRGFYRSWYYDSTGNKRWMGTTQFQPGHARQAFPCWDEPGFKATFDITIIRESGFSPSISNMPIAITDSLTEGRIAETFYTTPIMSTYLIAFIVSHYQVSDATPADEPRSFEIIARDNIGITGQWAFETGVALLEYMEEYTNISYYEMADNMNMKQVAIPDFSAGAMENWGLLTYREALILYDPAQSNHFYRQRVPNIVSHEIAHMWFGNLVTCDWWSNLWLNEGFARFYQYFLTGAVLPELGFETRFIVEQVHVSMLSDAVDSAHPLTHPNVNTPSEVSAHFSTITYARGASVIRMTQHLLGDETFVKALRSYLKAREYDVATPEHLFNELDAAAAEDQALAAYQGITVTEYFKTWSEKGGHPILTVSVNHQTGHMTVTQARWERDSGLSSVPSLWQIPITWTRQNAVDFANTKPSQVLTDQVTVIDRQSTGYEWVIFNKQQTGFYKINYDLTTWGLITLALRDDTQRNTIHEYNRAQIVDDLFQLARAGVMTYTRALNVLSFLEFETDYAPWLAAITGFNFMRRRLAHDTDSLQNLDTMILQLSTAVVQKLGYTETPDESYMDGLLRMYLMPFLCNVGSPGCRAAAVTNFANLRDNAQEVPPNLRPWVYCNGLRQGTAADFEFLWNRYVAHDLAGEKVVLLENLGCTPFAASLNLYLNEIVTDNDNIRPQDYTVALSSATSGNEDNTWIVFNWIQDNYQAIIDELGSLATPLNYVAGRLLTDTQLNDFEAWLNANPTLPGVATGHAGVAATRNNLAWSARILPDLTDYLENGYQEFAPPEETEPEETEPEETEPEETEPEETEPDETDPEDGDGSANVARVGFFTLIITLCINLLN